jgi:hypothetical protein
MPHHGMTPHTSGTSLSAQARYAARTREILECWFDGRPIREKYLIVDGGKLAGAGAHSYSAGDATSGSDEAARFKKGYSVVILGSAAPRKGSLTVQYFARLLGEPGEGARIVYAESIRDESKALDLMATWAVDTGIGVDFFNDPLRMHRDLLADVAQDYLPLLVDRPQ